MGLAEKVHRVLVEVAMLKIEADRKDPHNIWYKNEVARMLEEGQSLHSKAKEVDNNQFSNHSLLPKHVPDDIRREIDIISNNIAFLRNNMDIDFQYRASITRPGADIYQTTYSSSECQSSIYCRFSSSDSSSSSPLSTSTKTNFTPTSSPYSSVFVSSSSSSSSPVAVTSVARIMKS